MNAKTVKKLRKQARKHLAPLIDDHASKMRMLARKRPWWLPKPVYYWLLDQVIEFPGSQE